MRIYTKAGDLAFKLFTFPDGQPHFKLETYELDFRVATIETAIRNPKELMETLMAVDVLRNHGYSEVNLDIRYLLGARMDRAISSCEPFTLQLVARLLNGAGFSKIRILDVHSEVALKLIRNSVNVLPIEAIRQVFVTLKYPTVVSPDKGAYDRVARITHTIGAWSPFVQCGKEREVSTGKLLSFKVYNPELVKDTECLIIDDICDGGGTFVGLSKELRKAGAKKIYLYVTHGIFSKGIEALTISAKDPIDHIYTTDSYPTLDQRFGGAFSKQVTYIPISMKDL